MSAHGARSQRAVALRSSRSIAVGHALEIHQCVSVEFTESVCAGMDTGSVAITTSLQFLPGHTVFIELEDVFLQPGLAVHALTLRMKVQGRWLEETGKDNESYALMSIGGRLTVGQSMKPLADLPARVITLRGWPVPHDLVVLLTDDQLIAIEASRGVGNVELVLNVEGALLDVRPRLPLNQSQQVRYDVPGSRWLELLDQVGSALAVTVRVPSPLSDAAPEGHEAHPDASKSAAAGRLRQARIALRDGDYEKCVTSCRLVMDNIAALLPPTPPDVLAKVKTRERDQHQRWSAIFHDLYSLASGAQHDDEVTKSFTWARADAQAVLAAVAGLLARVH
jgi:hypothetical protein